MELAFKILKTTRQNILDFLDALSIEQVNKIPSGFSNNVVWNAGHIVATQQVLIYGLSGTPFFTSEDFVSRFRKGTKPEELISEVDLNEIKMLLSTTAEQIQKDYSDQIFGDFKPYTTSYNMHLTSVEEAIAFNNVHESLHFGYMKALGKNLSS
ncbi:MAG: DinB family protein [Cyclobacteriaceae bacterium]|nr:DinB family protein [Cyclobacteriaceae bacterium HetDA_MAG_MS6]